MADSGKRTEATIHPEKALEDAENELEALREYGRVLATLPQHLRGRRFASEEAARMCESHLDGLGARIATIERNLPSLRNQAHEVDPELIRIREGSAAEPSAEWDRAAYEAELARQRKATDELTKRVEAQVKRTEEVIALVNASSRRMDEMNRKMEESNRKMEESSRKIGRVFALAAGECD